MSRHVDLAEFVELLELALRRECGALEDPDVHVGDDWVGPMTVAELAHFVADALDPTGERSGCAEGYVFARDVGDRDLETVPGMLVRLHGLERAMLERGRQARAAG